jgi:hypothetical protein
MYKCLINVTTYSIKFSTMNKNIYKFKQYLRERAWPEALPDDGLSGVWLVPWIFPVTPGLSYFRASLAQAPPHNQVDWLVQHAAMQVSRCWLSGCDTDDMTRWLNYFCPWLLIFFFFAPGISHNLFFSSVLRHNTNQRLAWPGIPIPSKPQGGLRHCSGRPQNMPLTTWTSITGMRRGLKLKLWRNEVYSAFSKYLYCNIFKISILLLSVLVMFVTFGCNTWMPCTTDSQPCITDSRWDV